jgi:hypothetical protein
MYLAENQHIPELERVLNSRRGYRISKNGKQDVFNMVSEDRDGDPKLMLALLKDGEVDPGLSPKYWSNSIIWAAEKGSVELVQLLLRLAFHLIIVIHV